jgi:hypothetical protein
VAFSAGGDGGRKSPEHPAQLPTSFAASSATPKGESVINAQIARPHSTGAPSSVCPKNALWNQIDEAAAAAENRLNILPR